MLSFPVPLPPTDIPMAKVSPMAKPKVIGVVEWTLRCSDTFRACAPIPQLLAHNHHSLGIASGHSKLPSQSHALPQRQLTAGD